MSDGKQRLLYPDVLRLVAMFGVVLLHVGGFGAEPAPAADFYRSIRTWCVPVFVMLSGMFLLPPTKVISFETLYSKYILRILAGLCFWSLVYALVFWIIPQGTITANAILKGFKTYHLWFLYMILGLYLVLPLIKSFVATANNALLLYTVVLFFVFGVNMAVFNELAPMRHFTSLYAHFNMKLVLGFTGYFVLGYFLAIYKFSKRLRLVLYALGLAGLVISMIWNGRITETMQSRGAAHFYLVFMTTYTFFMSVAVFVWCKYNRAMLKWPARGQGFVHFLAERVFGIYFLHVLWIYALRQLNLEQLTADAWWYQPVMAVVVFSLSLLTTVMLERIPGFKKWLL